MTVARTTARLTLIVALLGAAASIVVLASAWLLAAAADMTHWPTLRAWSDAMPGPLADTVAEPAAWAMWVGISSGVAIVAGLGLAAMSGALRIARRSLRQHALSTCVTVASVALGAGLLMTVTHLQVQTRHTFEAAASNFDAVLGARGSELQIVLNSLYHIEQPPGNLPWAVYREIAEYPGVELAIPLAVGDNYRGFRVVGVDERLFTEHELDDDGTQLSVQPGGRLFDPQRREAVVGSFAARQLGLNVGDSFTTFHGLSYQPTAEHADDAYLVVGVLEATNTPMDRVLWIPLEGYFRMSGHVLRGAGEDYVPQAGEPIPDEHKEVSGVLLTFTSPAVGRRLDQRINRQGNVATLAWPVSMVVAQMFDRLGWVSRVLELVAMLVVLVAGGSILASVYNTMNERRREFAILRALGARKRTVFGAIVTESAAIALLGTAAGYAVYLALMGVTAAVLRLQVGVVLDVSQYHAALVLTPIGMTMLGAVAGIVPAIKAYATDVATHLAPQT